MMRYAMIGAAGYIAPKHMEAIMATGGELVAACDISDSVGILDRYFPDCEFFTSPERFQRHITKHNDFDYLVVCTPNYLHDAHIRMGLYAGVDIICEKPMVIKPKNVRLLSNEAASFGSKINVIQQMRLHPAFYEIDGCQPEWWRVRLDGLYQVKVNYVAPRGKWYHQSWKGDAEKSGGLAMNIGIHVFDLLIQIFGGLTGVYNVHTTENSIMGYLTLKGADVDFNLSIDANKKAKRELIIDKHVVDFSQGLEDLHIKSYQKIIAACGFVPEDVRPALELVDILSQWI